MGNSFDPNSEPPSIPSSMPSPEAPIVLDKSPSLEKAPTLAEAGTAIAAGGLKGATAGYIDEIAGLVMSASTDMKYDDAVKIARDTIDEAMAKSVPLSAVSEIVASSLPSRAIGWAAKGVGSATAGIRGAISKSLTGMEKGSEIASKSQVPGMLSKTAKGAAEGSIFGYGYGDETNPLNTSTLTGAGIGGLAGAFVDVANARSWKKAAGQKAASLISPISPDAERIIEKIPSSVSDVGEYLIKKGAIERGSTARTVYKEADILNKEIGKQTESLMKQFDTPIEHDVDGLLIREKAQQSDWYKKLETGKLPETQKVFNAVKEELNAIPTNMTIYEAHKLKQEIYRTLNPKTFLDPTAKLAAEEMTKNYSGIINEQIKAHLGPVNEKALTMYEELNQQWQKTKLAKDSALEKAYGYNPNKNKLASSSDIATAATYSPQYAAVKASANLFERATQPVRNMQALTYYTIGHNLDRLPQFAQKALNSVVNKGQKSFIAVHNALMENKEYEKEATAIMQEGSFDPNSEPPAMPAPAGE